MPFGELCLSILFLICKQIEQEMQILSLGQEDPLEEKMVTLSCLARILSHGQRSLVGYSPWGPKESDTAEQPNNKQIEVPLQK